MRILRESWSDAACCVVCKVPVSAMFGLSDGFDESQDMPPVLGMSSTALHTCTVMLALHC